MILVLKDSPLDRCVSVLNLENVSSTLAGFAAEIKFIELEEWTRAQGFELSSKNKLATSQLVRLELNSLGIKICQMVDY